MDLALSQEQNAASEGLILISGVTSATALLALSQMQTGCKPGLPDQLAAPTYLIFKQR